MAVAAGIFLSRVAGLIRGRAMAYYLGLSSSADAFNAALRIPNILQNLLGEGVLSASFIPVYARLLAEGKHAEASRVARARRPRSPPPVCSARARSSTCSLRASPSPRAS